MTPKILNPKPCLGFIGLGAIGLPIAANLLKAGFCLKVHTRSRKAESSKELKGAQSCATPEETAEGCDVLMICVSDDDAVEEVIFGSEGAEGSLKAGTIIIDFSTISPDKSISIHNKLSKKNIFYVDCPVSGGTEGAYKG